MRQINLYDKRSRKASQNFKNQRKKSILQPVGCEASQLGWRRSPTGILTIIFSVNFSNRTPVSERHFTEIGQSRSLGELREQPIPVNHDDFTALSRGLGMFRPSQCQGSESRKNRRPATTPRADRCASIARLGSQASTGCFRGPTVGCSLSAYLPMADSPVHLSRYSLRLPSMAEEAAMFSRGNSRSNPE